MKGSFGQHYTVPASWLSMPIHQFELGLRFSS
jgi:hypothetical protein